MSTVIEEKVVSMEFDNQHFEKNVKTSMTTIDKLKEKLNFDGMANSMQGLGDAAKKIDMGPLSDGIETVRAKFSAMQIMGITALQNITNSAINYGKRIVSSLTIDPIKTGLQEYETQIGAIQTILANTKSKGSTLEDVNTALDELNKYADRTIYNFTEMTKNIGTFTAAGVELDTSVSAIKGIANLAAVSGSTSQQASTAMYQLSQALAAGKIRLMDWNSVVNAGMGGEIFQESIKETARLHGVAIDDMIKNEGSFRETLKNDWFTAEILTETLSKFTGDLSEAQLKSKGYNDEQIKGIMELGEMANSAATDVKTFTQLMDTLKESAQSGWAQTWRIMIGDFEEAKGLWSQVSKSIGDIINDSAEARNNVLKEAFGSGWNKFIDKGIFDKDSFLYQVEQSAKKAGISLDELKEKFNGKFNSDALKEALKTGLIDSDMMSDALNNLTSLYKIMSPEQLKAKGFTDEQVKQLVAFNEEIQNGRTSMKNLVDEIAKLSGRELLMKAFGNIGQAIGNIVSPIKEAFVEIFDLKDASVVADRIYKIVEAFKNFTDHLKLNEKQMNNLKRTFKGVFAVFDIFLTVIKSVAGIITRLLDSVFGLDIGILGLTGTIGDYLVQFRDFIKSSNSLEIFADTVTEKFGKAVEGVKSFIASLKEKIKMPQFESFGDFLTTVWEKMKFIGGKIGEVFGQIWQGIKDIVSSIDLEKAFDNLASILFGAGVGAAGGGIYFGLVKFSEMIGNFGEVLSSFNPLNFVSDFLDRFRESTEKFSSETLLYTIKTVAKAVALLVASLAVLSLLDPEKVETGVGAIITMFSALLIATALLSKINFTKTVSSFSEKFKTAFGKGNLSKNVTTVNKSVGAMLAIAASVALLAVTLKVIATMEWEDIAKGLTVMTVALGELLLATWVISKIKITKAYRGATKILTLAGVLALVSLSLKFLATMDWKGMGVSLISMAGVFTILTAVTAIISKVRFSKTATATSKMVALAGMFTIMAASLRFLATMDWTGMGIALISMLSTFVILTSAAAIISKIKFTKTATATSKMVALAGAFAIMGVSLKVLSTMNWAGMGISLISMTGAFTALLGTLAIISKAKLSATGKDVLVLTGIAGVLLVMAGTLKLLSTLDWKGMGVALVSLTATVGLLTLLLTALKFIKVDLKNLVPLIAIAGSMIALAGALALLTPSLMALEKVRWENLGKAVTILGGLMAVLAGLGLLMTLSKASMGAVPVLAASLILLATSFAILAPALKMLNDVNWGAIGMAVVALLSFVVILGVAAGLMSAFPIAIAAVAVLALTLLSAAPACLGFSVAMIALTDSLERLSNIKFLDLAKGVLALSTAFLLMSAGVVAIGLLGPFALTASVALLAMATSLWLVSLALAGIANATDTGVNAMFNIFKRMLSLIPELVLSIGDAIIALCDVIIKAAPKIGEAALAIIRTVIDVIVKAAPEIADGVFRVIVNILEILVQYAEQVAILIFDFLVKVLGVLEDYIPELTEIGVNIILKFLDSIGKALNSIDMGSAENIAKAILVLSGVITLLNVIGPLVGGAVVTVLALAILIGELILIFVGLGALTKIDGFMALISEGNTLLHAISSITAILTNITVMAGIIGALAPFIGVAIPTILMLAIFMAELVAVLAIIGGISRIPGLNEIISDGGTLLQNIGNAIGKFVGSIVGGIGEGISSTLPQMATDLSTFMTNLTPFLNGIKMVDASVVEKVSALSTALLAITGSNLLNQITNWISGGSAMSTFSSQLAEFGEGIKGFNDAVVGITPETVKAAAEAGKLLGQMAKAIPTSGGLWDYLAGSNDLSGFAGQLGDFGDGIAAFGTATEGVTKDSILAAAEAGKLLGEMAKSIPTSGGLWDKLFGSDDLSGFATQLRDFGDGIAAFGEAVKGVGSYQADAIAAAELGKKLANTISDNGLLKSAYNTTIMGYFALSVKAYASAIKSFGEAMSGADFDSIRKGAEVGKVLSESMKVAAVNSSTIASEAFAVTAKQIFTSFGKSILTQMPGTQTAIKTVFKGVSSTIKAAGSSLHPEFRTIGAYLVQGFSNGIQNGIATVKSAALAMANSARDAIRNALKIFSPSRAAFEDGTYFVEGFVNALVAGLKGVFNASTDVADVAVEGLSSAIKQINSVIENGIDTNPTIKPIMDLSDLKSGASAIDRMFSMNPSLGVLANAQGINYAMNNRQNGGNGEVISAIRDLKEAIKDSYGGISIGDINYNPGSEIDDAVKALIRAITNEGRI